MIPLLDILGILFGAALYTIIVYKIAHLQTAYDIKKVFFLTAVMLLVSSFLVSFLSQTIGFLTLPLVIGIHLVTMNRLIYLSWKQSGIAVAIYMSVRLLVSLLFSS